jgi:aminopeptidase-like protein
MFKKILECINKEFSGDRAKQFVSKIMNYHRIQATPGFREAAKYCKKVLSEFGLSSEVLTYPADWKSKYWSLDSFEEWDVSEASLYITEPEKYRKKLADYNDIKLSLIQRSAPAEIEAEVVVLEDGEDLSEYENVNVKGKLVLTKGDFKIVYNLAVEKFGAIGIIFDGIKEVKPIRHRMDIPDAVQYSSFWWTKKDKKCFGFVLSPKEGEKLRKLIKERIKNNESPIKLKAKVDSKFYEGNIEVVSAIIPGETDEEIIIISHLCHPQGTANDNASGSATNLEIARTINKLINEGKLSKPKRSIRFLWVPEMTGTYAFLATQEERIPKMISAINLDMVGENQDICKSSFLIERTPDSNSSFVNDLVERIRDEFTKDTKNPFGAGRFASFKYANTPFSGGSDHYILSDPTVGISCPMLIQWPDKFYHTNLDTLEKVDPKMLKRIGVIAATYTYFLANADEKETVWLANEMMSKYKRKILKFIQGKITEISSIKDSKKFKVESEHKKIEADKISKKIKNENVTKSIVIKVINADKKLKYFINCQKNAFNSLKKLSPIKVDKYNKEIEEFTIKEFDKAKITVLKELGFNEDDIKKVYNSLSEKAIKKKGLIREFEDKNAQKWEEIANKTIIKRLYKGPIRETSILSRLRREQIEEFYKFKKENEEIYDLLITISLYWVNGKRKLSEIADLVELESGLRNTEFLVKYFDILYKCKLVELKII